MLVKLEELTPDSNEFKFLIDSSLTVIRRKVTYIKDQLEVRFPNTLIQVFPKVWYIEENRPPIKGANGKVNKSVKILDLRKGTVVFKKAKHVVKHEKIDSHSSYDLILKEATFQAKNDTKVYKPIKYKNTVVTVMEDCGEDLIQHLDAGITFEEALVFIQTLCAELLRLEKKTAVVHGDLKPDNICYRKSNSTNPFIPKIFCKIIDYGFANEVGEKIISGTNDLGTPYYTAPELHDPILTADKVFNTPIDHWALGPIIGQILGAKYEKIFGLRDLEYNEISKEYGSKFFTTGYDYKTLLKSKFKDAINNSFWRATVSLLQRLQSLSPIDRPSITYIGKFFSLAIYHHESILKSGEGVSRYQDHVNELNIECSNLIASIKNRFQGILKVFADQGDCQLIKKISKSLHDQFNTLIMKIRKIEQQTYLLQDLGRMTQNFLDNNLLTSEYPYLADLKKQWADYLESYKKLSQITNLILKFNSNGFKGTNSSGRAEILRILSSPAELNEKCKKLKTLGKSKTEQSLSNFYSRSSWIGKGRHGNMELLYRYLAQDLRGDNIKDLEKFISTTSSFVPK